MSIYSHKDYTASADISRVDISRYKVFNARTAGIILTLPAPVKQICRSTPVITNATSGYITVTTPASNFIGGAASIIVPPYASTTLHINYSSSTYYWVADSNILRSDSLATSLTWSPTLTFTTATPTLSTSSYLAWVNNGICYFTAYIATADGGGATALTITPPLRPNDINADIPIVAYALVDTTYTDIQGYIDAKDATQANRVIEFRNFATLTDDKTAAIWISGWYEVHGGGWETFTETETYGTSNWDSVTEVARHKNIDGVGHFVIDLTTADAKGVTSSLTVHPPTSPPDTNTYYPFMGHSQCVGGTDVTLYKNMLMFLDSANATEASRTAVSRAFGTCANGKAAAAQVSGIYESYGWSAFTPTLTFTGTAPTMAATVGRYKIIDNICYFTIYSTTTDGNGCTALVISGLPITPKYTGIETAVNAIQLVDTTYSAPLAFITTDEAAEADRDEIQFKSFSTCTDAKTATIYLSGWYPVG